VQASGLSTATQLEQRLGTAQLELRKLGSERHTLRSRLRRETDRVRELESALRAEKDLRRHSLEEHQTTLSGLRSRLASLESEDAQELADLREQLAQAQTDAARAEAEATRAKEQLGAAQAELARLRTAPAAPRSEPAAASPLQSAKQLQGLRRIRGIGPAYQRVLEQLGVTKVQQVAAWTPADVKSFALKLKIKPERIQKDDWVGQAKQLSPD
jgi:predicted flap endonuclease-1-like 5' DNA nuclease